MKKIGLFLLAAVMVAGLAGCSKDNDYNFNGTWIIQQQIVSQNGNWDLGAGRVQLVQDGNNLTWTWIDYNRDPRTGSCDPESGALHVRYISADGSDITINGLADDADTISGTMSGTNYGNSFTTNFTLELVNR